MKRKTSTKPTRVWKFAAKLETPSEAREILWRKGKYYNALVEIERARVAKFNAVRHAWVPELASLEREWDRLDEQVGALYREAKRERQAHWRASGGDKARLLPSGYEARIGALDEQKRAVSAAAKPLRASFLALIAPAQKEYTRRTKERAAGGGPRTKSIANAQVLDEMMGEPGWPDAWKEVAASDRDAHGRVIAARSACRLYAGTYLDVEEAVARAKSDSAPRCPRFHATQMAGKIRVQIRGGIRWSELSTAMSRLAIEVVEKRAGSSERTRMRRVILDQSVGEDETLVVQAMCRLHRLPPDDAEVKWVALVVRPRGRCELQITLEHESFGLPKRPAGDESPVHVALGWSRAADGLRVARLLRAGQCVEEICCPESIVRQKEYAESVESAGDALRARALRTLRTVLYLGGNRPSHWHRMVTDRQREPVRRLCEAYASHVLGGDVAVRERWGRWVQERKARGEDLYAPLRVCRATIGAREALAWWLWLWARKDRHLERLAADSLRRFAHRRDAHYRRECIRIATRCESVTVDEYSVAALKEREPLTMPGTGVRDMAQWQLHAAAPGRLRECLIEVMGSRCVPSERPSDAPEAASARKPKRVRSRGPTGVSLPVPEGG